MVLFKDHYVPRTLRIPLHWIPRLGIMLSIGTFGFVVSLLLAAQGWFLAWKAQPQRLRTLEDQIENLRRSNDALETELRALRRGDATAPLLGMRDGDSEAPASPENSELAETPSLSSSFEKQSGGLSAAARMEESASRLFNALFGTKEDAPPPIASTDPFISDISSGRDNPANSGTGSTAGTEKEEGTTLATASASAEGIPFLLPDATEGGVPSPGSLPFRLTPIQTESGGGTLALKFALQYVAEDGGNQQGRIVILGRAGDRFAAYPDAALSASAYPLAQAPLSPERGEFFSVSRYREVLGQLSLPSDARQDFNEIWILIFNTRGKLLYSQNRRLATPAPSPSASASASASGPASGTTTAPTPKPGTVNTPISPPKPPKATTPAPTNPDISR